MIEEPPLLLMAKTIERPNPNQLDPFRGVPTSFICDAMGGSAALDWRIKPIGPPKLLGTALTCHCGPADILALGVAVQICEPGDVLVVATDSYTGTAVVGDLMLGIAKNRGAAGLITDGLVRDRNDIESLDFPVFAMGVCPNSPHEKGPGSVGLPILCGGRQIATGDVIVGDRDGVVTLPRALLTEVADKLKAVQAAEAEMFERVRGGLREVTKAAAVLAGNHVRYIYP
jgi:4-hydroxy-4-methyl-2-oxoglutarate aldolase